MVEIPDKPLAEFVIRAAREFGEYRDVYDTAHEGMYGQHEYDTDWSLADLKASECTVEADEDMIRVFGTVDASYSVRTARKTHHHPAEYENRTMPLHVSLIMPLDELPSVIIEAESA